MRRFKRVLCGVGVVFGVLGGCLCVGLNSGSLSVLANDKSEVNNVSSEATNDVTSDITTVSDGESVSLDDVVEEDEDFGEVIDEALNEVTQEEEYIVSLTEQNTGVDITTADWNVCLDYLRNNYNQLVNNPEVDGEKVESYVNAYNIVEQEQNMPLEDVNPNAPITRAKYDPKKVTAYTDKWWNSINPKYPDFNGKGGDCANFVSQALHAGGKPMKGSVATDFANWFCKSNNPNHTSKISSTWRGADAFGHYWRANAKGYKTFGKTYFTSREAFKPVYNYTSVGDPISFLNENGRPYHTVIVSYKNRKTQKNPKGTQMIDFASHTGNHKWRSVYGYMKGTPNGIRVYDMY